MTQLELVISEIEKLPPAEQNQFERGYWKNYIPNNAGQSYSLSPVMY